MITSQIAVALPCHAVRYTDSAQGRQAVVLPVHTFVITGVLDEVLFEDAHEDGGQEASQQQHRHTRVDDAEPVNLHSRGRSDTQPRVTDGKPSRVRLVMDPHVQEAS